MIFTRFITCLLFLVSFGLLTAAKPIETIDLATRELSVSKLDDALLVRGDTHYPENPCGCGQDLLDVLVKLKVDIDVELDLLDGIKDPTVPCQKIILLLNAAVDLIAKIVIKIGFTVKEIQLCLEIIVKIVINIALCLKKYSIIAILTLAAQIDIALAAFIKICIKICIDLQVLIKSSLSSYVTLLTTVKLLLTLAACGL